MSYTPICRELAKLTKMENTSVIPDPGFSFGHSQRLHRYSLTRPALALRATATKCTNASVVVNVVDLGIQHTAP